ncbi:MAG TPA: GTPase domain-containing protein [Tepidisphaeraceae bacterium]|jgi:ethanolamine utilization protein EutP (predicted NTPase)|nr:GTPase domain-containing protein [Tepidisphaeraceae bacterium]
MAADPDWLKLVLKYMPDMVELFRKAFSKHARILAVGSTGTGKTALVNSLQDEMIPRMIEEINRTQFAKEEKVKLNKTAIKINDTPGHRINPDEHDSPFVNPQLDKAVRTGTYVGVINVVSYGYHQYDADPKPDFSITKLDAYLSEHRKRENIGLTSWASRMSTMGKNPFVITVVTKADLWQGTSGVLQHYESGEYYKEFRKLAGPDIQHIAVRMSARKQKFYAQIDPAADWDDDDRAIVRSNLIQQMTAAIAASRS